MAIDLSGLTDETSIDSVNDKLILLKANAEGMTDVTFAQIKAALSLNNVTNDAQLKRADNDWGAITEETSPDNDDILLLEKTTTGYKRKIKVSNIGGGTGEINTASNQGTGGVGLYDDKVLYDLQFKNINAGSSKITVTDDVANKEVDIDVDVAELAFNTLTEKTTLASSDLLILGDSGNSYINKKVQLSSLWQNRKFNPSLLADGGYQGDTLEGLNAGEDLTAGTLVYISSDGKLYKAKGDSATTMPALFLITVAVSTDDPAIALMPNSLFRMDSWSFSTPGVPVYIDDDTAGLATVTRPTDADDYVQICGIVVAANIVHFTFNLMSLKIKSA